MINCFLVNILYQSHFRWIWVSRFHFHFCPPFVPEDKHLGICATCSNRPDALPGNAKTPALTRVYKSTPAQFFVPHNLDLWLFDPRNKWLFRTHRGTFLWSLVILAAAVFEISCAKTDRQTNSSENLTFTTAICMGNQPTVSALKETKAHKLQQFGKNCSFLRYLGIFSPCMWFTSVI